MDLRHRTEQWETVQIIRVQGPASITVLCSRLFGVDAKLNYSPRAARFSAVLFCMVTLCSDLFFYGRLHGRGHLTDSGGPELGKGPEIFQLLIIFVGAVDQFFSVVFR